MRLIIYNSDIRLAIIGTAGFWVSLLVVLGNHYLQYTKLEKTDGLVVMAYFTYVQGLNDTGGEKLNYEIDYYVDGRTYRLSTEHMFLPRSYWEGDVVNLLYDPNDPERAWINSFLGYWIRGPQGVIIVMISIMWFGLYNIYRDAYLNVE